MQSLLTLLLGLPTARDFHLEGILDSVDEVSTVTQCAILKLDNRRLILVDFLGQLCLGQFRVGAGLGDRCGAHV